MAKSKSGLAGRTVSPWYKQGDREGGSVRDLYQMVVVDLAIELDFDMMRLAKT